MYLMMAPLLEQCPPVRLLFPPPSPLRTPQFLCTRNFFVAAGGPRRAHQPVPRSARPAPKERLQSMNPPRQPHPSLPHPFSGACPPFQPPHPNALPSHCEMISADPQRRPPVRLASPGAPPFLGCASFSPHQHTVRCSVNRIRLVAGFVRTAWCEQRWAGAAMDVCSTTCPVSLAELQGSAPSGLRLAKLGATCCCWICYTAGDRTQLGASCRGTAPLRSLFVVYAGFPQNTTVSSIAPMHCTMLALISCDTPPSSRFLASILPAAHCCERWPGSVSTLAREQGFRHQPAVISTVRKAGAAFLEKAVDLPAFATTRRSSGIASSSTTAWSYLSTAGGEAPRHQQVVSVDGSSRLCRLRTCSRLACNNQPGPN